MPSTRRGHVAVRRMTHRHRNQGRLDVYKTIDPDEAILEIEQMIKNLKTKDMSPEEINKKYDQMRMAGDIFEAEKFGMEQNKRMFG